MKIIFDGKAHFYLSRRQQQFADKCTVIKHKKLMHVSKLQICACPIVQNDHGGEAIIIRILIDIATAIR